MARYCRDDNAGDGACPRAKRISDLEAALRDARTYVEASSLNMTSKDGRRNYRQCLARIDAALNVRS